MMCPCDPPVRPAGTSPAMHPGRKGYTARLSADHLTCCRVPTATARRPASWASRSPRRVRRWTWSAPRTRGPTCGSTSTQSGCFPGTDPIGISVIGISVIGLGLGHPTTAAAGHWLANLPPVPAWWRAAVFPGVRSLTGTSPSRALHRQRQTVKSGRGMTRSSRHTTQVGVAASRERCADFGSAGRLVP
jgi:hypothetical protein